MSNKILVVDDEQIILDLLKDLLQTQGYQIETATNGIEALELLNENSYDLFIIDFSMPYMDGMQLLAEIKKLHPLAVIIVLTGYSSIEGAVNAINKGAYQYLSKPIKSTQLFYIVKKAMEHSDYLKETSPQNDGKRYYSLLPSKPQILFGFTPDQITEFYAMGTKKTYQIGEEIILSETKDGSVIVIESGEVSVSMCDNTFEYLKKYDTWGEENITLETFMPVDLKAESLTEVIYFKRRDVLTFFNSKEDLLWKRFIINISNNIFIKWRKTIQRLIMLKLITDTD